MEGELASYRSQRVGDCSPAGRDSCGAAAGGCARPGHTSLSVQLKTRTGNRELELVVHGIQNHGRLAHNPSLCLS